MIFLTTIKNKSRWDRIRNERIRKGLVEGSMRRGVEKAKQRLLIMQDETIIVRMELVVGRSRLRGPDPGKTAWKIYVYVTMLLSKPS